MSSNMVHLTEDEINSAMELKLPVPNHVSEEYYVDPDIGPPLRVYLAIEAGTVGQDLSELDQYYNLYLWNCKFTKAFRDKFNNDYGIEQQNEKMLEYAPEVDWAVMEEIHNSTLGPYDPQ